MEEKEIYKEKEINTTTLRRNARNLLVIMFALIMIIVFVYFTVQTENLFFSLSGTMSLMLFYPLLSLVLQLNGGGIPIFISFILSILSSMNIYNILTTIDNKKITKSFKMLKKEAIIMLIFDCIVFIWFCIKGFPLGLNHHGPEIKVDVFEGIVSFIISYLYSIVTIIYTGILWIITDDEDEIEVEEQCYRK